jgi:hypothetical protein
MHKQRVYIDTSVIGGCFDEEFEEWSNRLFDAFILGSKVAVLSDLTSDELARAPEYIRKRIDDIPIQNREILLRNSETEFLAEKYIEFKVISEKFFDDATHIALSTVNNVDVLVSWNFKHMVNLTRILKYNSINLMFGYKALEIRNPKEILDNEEEI